MNQKILNSARIFMLLAMPFMVFFSYYPMLNFGQSHGMHFEISLLQTYLVLFVLINLPAIWQIRQQLIKNKTVWLIFAFCSLNTISLLWTANLIKGLLILAVIWLLFACFLSFLSYKNLKKLFPTLFKNLIIASCIMSVFALFQIFAEIINLPPSISLLCDGCRTSQFGFARVTGFAIEPQFFGSLLLIPILLLLHKFINQKTNYKLNLTLIFLLVTLFLTLSRGAIYALAIGIIVLLIINWKNLKKIFLSLTIIFGSFLLSLTIQGVSAEINPNINDGFYPAISRTIHQLSLGLIDIRSNPLSSSKEAVEEGRAAPLLPAEREERDPIRDGYVAESTDIRNHLSRLALEAWAKTPTNIIFGTGTGSTGFVLNHYFPDQIGDTEITQNQYTETLLENGLIGFALFAALIFLLFKSSHKHKFLWAILSAFLIQWFFFSGYPNALHIYLFLLLFGALTSRDAYASIKAEYFHEKQKKSKKP